MRFKSKEQLPIILLLISIATFSVPLVCEAITLDLKYKPLSKSENLLASVSPIKIKLSGFEDKREGDAPKLVGGMKRSKRGAVYDVKSKQTASEIIREAVSTELLRNGHSVVDDNEDFAMEVDIKTFWLRTDPSRDMVDVIVEIEILIKIVNADSGKSTFLGPYSSKYVEGRKKPDSSSVMKRVFNRSLNQLMQKMGSDVELASALESQ